MSKSDWGAPPNLLSTGAPEVLSLSLFHSLGLESSEATLLFIAPELSQGSCRFFGLGRQPGWLRNIGRVSAVAQRTVQNAEVVPLPEWGADFWLSPLNQVVLGDRTQWSLSGNTSTRFSWAQDLHSHFRISLFRFELDWFSVRFSSAGFCLPLFLLSFLPFSWVFPVLCRSRTLLKVQRFAWVWYEWEQNLYIASGSRMHFWGDNWLRIGIFFMFFYYGSSWSWVRSIRAGWECIDGDFDSNIFFFAGF